MLHDQFAMLKDRIIKNNTINPDYYQEYEVKRGLRNRDGSGVLAGLTNISSVVGSKIIDGDSIAVDGELKFRGIPLLEFMSDFDERKKYCFETLVFLLLVGDLPSEVELKDFSAALASQRHIPNEILEHVIKGIPSQNMMNKLQTAISALYAFDETAESVDPYDNFLQSVSLIAKLPAIIAYSYLATYVENPQFVKAPEHLTHAEAFLYMFNQGKEASALENHILDLSLGLHAEHGGGNNSTFTTYVVSSSASDIYSTTAASVGSLKGPLHGSANKKVRDMMQDIQANMSDLTSESELTNYVNKILNKEAHDKSGKLYGLGHAVYTKSDPRAIVIKDLAKKLAKKYGREDELQLYFNLEKLGPELFNTFKGSKKVISPNVDFFSGFVYDCLSFPVEIYTPLFAMARCAGWCAHRIEEGLSGKRIIRPGYKFVAN